MKLFNCKRKLMNYDKIYQEKKPAMFKVLSLQIKQISRMKKNTPNSLVSINLKV